MSSLSLTDIETLTRKYDAARTDLNSLVSALQEEMEAARREALPRLRKLVARTAESHAALKAGIEAAPALFVKPKTLVISGIKVGFVKQPGRLDIADPDKVVALIEKHLPDLEDTLVSVKKTPVKKALEQLSAAELKKLGVSVTEDTDAVVIKPVDDNVDKLVLALLKECAAELSEPA